MKAIGLAIVALLAVIAINTLPSQPRGWTEYPQVPESCLTADYYSADCNPTPIWHEGS